MDAKSRIHRTPRLSDATTIMQTTQMNLHLKTTHGINADQASAENNSSGYGRHDSFKTGRKLNTIQCIHKVACILALFGVLTSCTKEARIVGKVTDIKGAPVSSATIAIEGTQFQSMTNANGDYSIQFIPGRVALKATAPDYLVATAPFEVVQASTVPAATIKLIHMPSIPQWEKFIFSELQNKKTQTFLGGDVKIEDMAHVGAVNIDSFVQVGDREVTCNVTVTYRAVVNLARDAIGTSALKPYIDGGQHSEGEKWRHRFNATLKFEDPNTWSWINTTAL